MSKPPREPGSGSLPSVRGILSVAAVAVVGRALTYAAIDAFLLYVFGNPAVEHDEPLRPVMGSRPREAARQHRRAA